MGGSNFVTLGPVPDAQSDSVLSAIVNTTASVTTVIAAIAGKRIWVHGVHLTANTLVAFFPQDVGAASTVSQTGPLLIGQAPFVLPWQNYPYWTCAAGNALVFSQAGGAQIQISGRIMYVQG